MAKVDIHTVKEGMTLICVERLYNYKVGELYTVEFVDDQMAVVGEKGIRNSLKFFDLYSTGE